MVTLVLPTAVAVLGLVCLSAFFSSSETAIFAVSEEWIASQTDQNAGRTLKHLREDPHRLLVTILVGNNVVNILITSLTTAVLVETLPTGVAIPAATVLVSVLVLVFGEIVPKSYGFGNAQSWALRVARPLALIERLMGPVITVFDVVTGAMSSLVGGDPTMEERFLDE